MKTFTRLLSLALISACYVLKVNAQTFPFWHYTTADELASSGVNDIYQDSKGFLWFATDRGISRFDGFKFNNYLYAEGLPVAKINGFTQNKNGQILAATPYKGVEQFGFNFSELIHASDQLANDQSVVNGNFFYSLQAHVAVYVTALDNLRPFEIQIEGKPNAMLLSGNEILIATDNGLYSVDANNAVSRSNSITQPVYSLFVIKGELYAGSHGEILHADEGGKTRVIPIREKQPVTHLLCSRSGVIWYSTGRNISYIAGDKQIDLTEKLHIEGTQINRLFEDHEGNIWIATTGKGVICLHHFFAENYARTDGLDNDYITSLAAADGSIYAGTKGGVYRAGDDGIHLVEITKGWNISKLRFSGDQLWVYRTDSGKALTISGLNLLSYNPSLFLLDNQSRGIVKSMLGSRSLTIVNDVLVDKSKRIWIATTDGIFCNDRSVVVPDTTFLVTNVTSIAENRDGTVYFGTDNGLAVYEKGKWKFNHQAKGKNIESITSLVVDGEDRLWAGTLIGLYILDGESVFDFDTKNILLSDEVNALCFDAVHNRIWVGTSSGLTRIDIPQFNSAQHFAPLAIFKNLRTDDSVYRDIDLNERITLPYNSRNFTLRFSAIHFSMPEGVKFFYNYDDAGWQPATGRQIEFVSIPYGEHTILIKAVGEHDLAGPPAELILDVQTPFWAAVWFKICIGLVGAALIYFVFRRRFEIVKKKQQEKLEIQAKIAELRHQALAASMNPHFIFNSLNSIQNFINTHDTEEASEYLGKFARLIRIMLNSGGKTFITLKDELERLHYYLDLEKIRFGNKLSFEIEVDDKLQPEAIEIPNMVIQPIVENALWHGLLPAGRDGILKISFSKMDGAVRVIVDDNGIGLLESKRRKKSGHVSLGLQLIEERLALLKRLNGYSASIAIIDKSELPGKLQGTRAEVILG